MRNVLRTQDRKQELSDFGWTLAQLAANDGSPIALSQVLGVDLFVYDKADPSTILYSITLNPTDVIFDPLRLTPNWTQDTKGYNFGHYLTQQSVFPLNSLTKIEAGGHTYRLEYRINTVSSGILWVIRESTTVSIISGGTAGGGGGGGTPDFSLTATPSSATVFAGFYSDVTIGVVGSGGMPAVTVNLVAAGVGSVPGISFAWTPPGGNAIVGGSAALRISADIQNSVTGNYTIRVTGSYQGLSHTVDIALNVQNVGGGQQGWTTFAPVVDTRQIYVSFSTGNDSAPGDGTITHPYKTIAKGYGDMRDGHPDWLLLKKGDTWTEGLRPGGQWAKGGLNATQDLTGAYTGMMRIGAYGSGARPKISTPYAFGDTFYSAASGSFLALTELELTCSDYDGTQVPQGGPPGNHGIHFNAAQCSTIVEGCWIHNYWECMLYFPSPANGVQVNTNIAIRRNIITEAYSKEDAAHQVGSVKPQGLYMEYHNGYLIEENLFDNCGWIDGDETTRPSHAVLADYGAQGNLFRHCMYIQNGNRAGIVRGNIMSRTDGIQFRGGGVLQNNLSLQLATAFTFGDGAFTSLDPNGVTGQVKGNVCLGNSNLSPNVLDQRGWAFICGNIASLEFSYNIVAHSTLSSTTGTPCAFRFNFDDGGGNPLGCQNVNFHNNIDIDWPCLGANSVGSVGFYGNNVVTNFIWQDNIHQITTEGVSGHNIFSTFDAGNNRVAGANGLKEIKGGGNKCFRTNVLSDPNLFRDVNAPGGMTGAAFFADIAGLGGASSDTTSIVETTAHAFTNPNRTIVTYLGTLGITGVLLDFINGAKANSKDAWNVAYTADAVNSYIQQGFDLPVPP